MGNGPEPCCSPPLSSPLLAGQGGRETQSRWTCERGEGNASCSIRKVQNKCTVTSVVSGRKVVRQKREKGQKQMYAHILCCFALDSRLT